MRVPGKTKLMAILFAAISAMAVVLAANAMVVAETRVPSIAAISYDQGPNGTLVLQRIVAPPGTLLRIQPAHVHFRGSFELVVLPGGDADALHGNETPADTILHRHPLPDGVIQLKVPDLGRPPQSAGWETGLLSDPGDSWAFNHSADFQRQSSLDVVWRNRAPQPACEDVPRACLENHALYTAAFTRDDHGNPKVQVVDATVDRLQPIFYGLAGLAAAVAAATLILLFAGRRKQVETGASAPTEAILQLIDNAYSYLNLLRSLLMATGVMLVLLGFFGWSALEDFSAYIAGFQPSDTWHDLIVGGLAATFLAVIAGWLAALLLVQRELRRFQAHLSERPLG